MIGVRASPRDAAQMDPSWLEAVGDELETPGMRSLRAFLRAEVDAGRGFFPPAPLVFNALRLTPLRRVRVVILGQDPYHGPGQAMGLSFSVPPGVAQPPSLRNIFGELSSDLGLPTPTTGDLTPWAESGVLLLNSVLTVAPRSPASHAGKGWEAIHGSRDCRAVRPSRRDRLPPLGPLCAAEGRDRRHRASPRPHGGAPVAVLGPQRLLRVPTLLARERAPCGRRGTGGRLAAPGVRSAPGKRRAGEQRAGHRLAALVADNGVGVVQGRRAPGRCGRPRLPAQRSPHRGASIPSAPPWRRASQGMRVR